MNTKAGWWRAWMFTLGPIALALGLLTLSSTGERFERIAKSVEISHDLKLGISAGHGLNYVNIKRFKIKA